MAPATDMAAIRLGDGRRLTYQTVGRPDSFPVVYMHGAIGSPRWRSAALDAAVAALVSGTWWSTGPASAARTTVPAARSPARRETSASSPMSSAGRASR